MSWDTCLWVWEDWEQGPGHRAPLSRYPEQWVMGLNPVTHRGRFGLRLSSRMSTPAGMTPSFTLADRLMVTFDPAMPHSISGLHLNPQDPAGKQRQERFPAAQECCEGREVHYRQIATCSDNNS